MSNVGDPAGYAAPVVPSDATVFASPTRSLYIGVAGNVTVRMYEDGRPTGRPDVTFPNVPVGVLPVRCDKVLATGTAAASIVAMW